MQAQVVQSANEEKRGKRFTRGLEEMEAGVVVGWFVF